MQTISDRHKESSCIFGVTDNILLFFWKQEGTYKRQCLSLQAKPLALLELLHATVFLDPKKDQIYVTIIMTLQIIDTTTLALVYQQLFKGCSH